MVFAWINASGECAKKRYHLLHIVNPLCGKSGACLIQGFSFSVDFENQEILVSLRTVKTRMITLCTFNSLLKIGLIYI